MGVAVRMCSFESESFYIYYLLENYLKSSCRVELQITVCEHKRKKTIYRPGYFKILVSYQIWIFIIRVRISGPFTQIILVLVNS